MTDPVKVLDDLVKGLVLVAYDFIRLTLFGLFLPVLRYARKWRSLRKLPLLTLSTTKRLSALTYLVIWILLVVVHALGRSTNFAAGVVGLQNNTEQSGFSVPVLFADVLFIAFFVDVSLRLTLSGIHNRIRRDLYGWMGRIAVANIFCGAFIILVVESYRIRDNVYAFFGPLPALFWPLEFLNRWFVPTNPLLCIFAVALAIVFVKAYKVTDFTRRLLIGVTVVVFAPTILGNVSAWLTIGAFNLGTLLAPSTGLELADPRCTASSGQVNASVVLRQSDRDFLTIDPHSFVIRLPDPRTGKNGKKIEDIGRVTAGQTPLILSRSKPMSITETVTLYPGVTQQIDLQPTFECKWVVEENALVGSSFSRVNTWRLNDD
jgi:hypothetical protein